MNLNQPLISNYAKDMLVKGRHIDFVETVSFPLDVKNYPAYYYLDPHLIDFPENENLYLFPNPCGDFVIVYFNTTFENHLGTIAIFDLQGKELDRIKLNCFQNQLIVNLSDYPNGVYIVSLIVDNKLLASRKLSKARK